jgi:hypothetical protein
MKKVVEHDWSRFDALTDADVHAAALADPDAQPLTEERLKRMKRVPQIATRRRALALIERDGCMETKPRPITPAFLNELVEWTRTADMFRSSPEGRAFGEEMRAVIELAKIGLNR